MCLHNVIFFTFSYFFLYDMNKQVTVKLDCVMVVVVIAASNMHGGQICGTPGAVKLELKSF